MDFFSWEPEPPLRLSNLPTYSQTVMSTSPISPVTGRRSPAVPIPPFELPPLPVIQNPKYANLVFTHSSMIPHLRNASSFDLVDGDADLDNEKLEHIGDALIGQLSSS